MRVTLEHTNAAKIARQLVRARIASGSPAMDMVLTFIVVCDEETVADALQTATMLSKEHPARVIGVILGSGTGASDLQAKVRVGSETSGESILLRMSGPLVKHAESAVLPLLLPDSPVVVWWAGPSPTDPAGDPIGALASRRLTDAEVAPQPVRRLKAVARHYSPGDTDLSWTRLTPWRALLAAALDQVRTPATNGVIESGSGNPAAVLLQAWLEDRLGISVTHRRVDSDRIERVVLTTERGDVCVARGENGAATFSVPGSHPHTVPLPTRSRAELLAEDLRRLDADQIYRSTIEHLLSDS